MFISPVQTAALINVFVLKMDQMTMCDVKEVAHSNNPAEKYQDFVVFLISTGHFSIFQLILSVFQSAIALVHSHRSRQCCFFRVRERQETDKVSNSCN